MEISAMKHVLFRMMIMVVMGMGLMWVADAAVAADATGCTATNPLADPNSVVNLIMPSTIFNNVSANTAQPVVVGSWREKDVLVAKCTSGGSLDILILGHNALTGWNQITLPGHDGPQRTYYANPVSNDGPPNDSIASTLGIIAEILGDNGVTVPFYTGGVPLQVNVPDTGPDTGDVILHTYYEFVLLKNTPASGSIPVPDAYVGSFPPGFDWTLEDSNSEFDRNSNLFHQSARAYVFTAPTCTISPSIVKLNNGTGFDPNTIPKYDSSYLSSTTLTYPWQKVTFNTTNCNVNGVQMTFKEGTATTDNGFPVTMDTGPSSDAANLEVMLKQNQSNGSVFSPPKAIRNDGVTPYYLSCDSVSDAASNNNCAPSSDLDNNVTTIEANLFKTDNNAVVASGQGSATIVVNTNYL